MGGSRMLELVSPCGLYCGGCPLYRARTDKGLAERIAQGLGAERIAQGLGVSVDRVPVCLGCRAEEGCVAVVGEPVCATYNCAVNKKALDFCYQCEDFPCLKLAPCADRAQEIPHNSKIYNLLSPLC